MALEVSGKDESWPMVPNAVGVECHDGAGSNTELGADVDEAQQVVAADDADD